MAFGIGFVYDLIVEFLHLWNHHLNSRVLFGSVGERLADLRFEARLNATAVYFGLGYIIGVRYAGIIAAGSVLSMLVLVPPGVLRRPRPRRSTDAAHRCCAGRRDGGRPDLRRAMSGRWHRLHRGRRHHRHPQDGKIIVSSLSLGFKGLVGGGGGEAIRTDRDMQPRNTFLIQAGARGRMFLLFWFLSGQITTALVGTVITFPAGLPVHAGGGASDRHRRRQTRCPG